MNNFEKKFINFYNKISNDIIDNYPKYSLNDRIRVFKLLVKMIKVNAPLNSYDDDDTILTPDEHNEEKEKHDKYFR